MIVNRLDGDRIYTIARFLNVDDCQTLIDRAEAIGFGSAPLSTVGGEVFHQEIRNNDRAMVDDPDLAGFLFDRARPLLPPTWKSLGRDWVLDRLNPRLRFYRYDPGQKFAPHYDGHYRAPDHSMSFLTFLVYLRGGVGGGSTRFYRRIDLGRHQVAFEVVPEAGTALIFAHDELHEGSPVESGRKYVVRSDVMYRLASPPPVAGVSPE